MDISGASSVAHTLEVKSVQMANSQQKQEGRAVLELLEAAESVSAPSASSAGRINTYA